MIDFGFFRTFREPCHIAQLEELWSHLHDVATFASSQRGLLKYHLDLQLKSINNSHTDVLKYDAIEDIRYWVETQRNST
uniref:Uncharacterized protein n=1 Tax=Gouania willdenowi TaxID=441366 RepID=A0A8C5NCB2_GOUWI